MMFKTITTNDFKEEYNGVLVAFLNYEIPFHAPNDSLCFRVNYIFLSVAEYKTIYFLRTSENVHYI